MARPKCQQPLTLCPAHVCSLYGACNLIGVEGAKSLAEALGVNGTLTSIEYATTCPLSFLIRQSVSSR